MATQIVQPGGSIQTAVDYAKEGDLILVHDGVYLEQVVIRTNYIRIVATGHQVVMKGEYDVLHPLLPHAFLLDNVKGVEIKGFQILCYSNDGIHVRLGAFNRIIANKISRCGNSAINFAGSDGNLAYQNEVRYNGMAGIEVSQNGSSNRIIENTSQQNDWNGITIYEEAQNNTVACNTVDCNEEYGVAAHAPDTFIYGNKIKSNGLDGIRISHKSANSMVIGNHVSDNKENGIELEPNSGGALLDSYNTIVQSNVSSENLCAGIQVSSPLNILESNCVYSNKKDGIAINGKFGNRNILVFNDLKHNVSYDLHNSGVSNQFYGNHCESSEPPHLCSNKEHCPSPHQPNACETKKKEHPSPCSKGDHKKPHCTCSSCTSSHHKTPHHSNDWNKKCCSSSCTCDGRKKDKCCHNKHKKEQNWNIHSHYGQWPQNER